MVSLRNVSKSYVRGRQSVAVLHGVDLDIPDGDFVALMGPSGSGKTTLLNLIGGLDSPTSGSVEVAGARLETLNSGQLAHWRAANVGFIFQFYNLLPMLSGYCSLCPYCPPAVNAVQLLSMLSCCCPAAVYGVLLISMLSRCNQ